jgi:hypothetical protein
LLRDAEKLAKKFKHFIVMRKWWFTIQIKSGMTTPRNHK